MGVKLLQPGDQCGPYRIVREIGRGGMAVVYLAEGPEGEQRAIKTLQFAERLGGGQLDRFKREIQLLAAIDHVHVVRFYEAGKVEHSAKESLIWVALEYLEGQTLRQIIRERGGRLPVEDVARWCKHVADGVAAAHQLRVIHRDLKPENVSVVHGIAKVFDFGIAKFRQWGVRTTNFKTRLGTIGYMAPEQLQGQTVDGRTDVFALGVILYELSSGAHPICPARAELTPAEIVARCMTLVPPPLHEVVDGFPADLSAIADQALRKRPEERFESMLELSDALAAALRRCRAEGRSAKLGQLGGDLKIPSSLEAAGGAAGAAGAAGLPGEAEPPTEPRVAPRGAWAPGQGATVALGVPDEVEAAIAARDGGATGGADRVGESVDHTALPPTTPFPDELDGQPTRPQGRGARDELRAADLTETAPSFPTPTLPAATVAAGGLAPTPAGEGGRTSGPGTVEPVVAAPRSEAVAGAASGRGRAMMALAGAVTGVVLALAGWGAAGRLGGGDSAEGRQPAAGASSAETSVAASAPGATTSAAGPAASPPASAATTEVLASAAPAGTDGAEGPPPVPPRSTATGPAGSPPRPQPPSGGPPASTASGRRPIFGKPEF